MNTKITFVLVFILSLAGCSNWRNQIYNFHHDICHQFLISESASLSRTGYNERGLKTALKRINDDKIDSDPIIIYAYMEDVDSNPYLYIACYDEDRDIRGIIVRE